MVSLGIFSVVTPTEPRALSSTQPLKVSTRDFSWGKGGRCVWLTTYHPCSAETSRKSGALIYPEPFGPPRPVAGHLYFTLLYTHTHFFHFRMMIYFTITTWNIRYSPEFSIKNFIHIWYFNILVYFKLCSLKLCILHVCVVVEDFLIRPFYDKSLRMATRVAETCTSRSLTLFIM